MMPWDLNGLNGWGDAPPRLAGNFSGPLVILGGARCVWNDVKFVENLLPRERCHHMAVNDIGAYWHYELTHWVSLHPMYMSGWRKFRMGHGYGNGAHVFTHSFRMPSGNNYPDIDFWWDIDFGGGTSGMFGCFVAFGLGYSKVILAGIPMDGSGHFFDAPWYKTPELEGHSEKTVWTEAARGRFNNRVKSASGNTRDWLGEPTEEWLNG